MAEIELHPGIPFCDVSTLNRVARQQGLCMAIAQAFVHDEICRAVELPAEQVEFELQTYLQEMGITSQTALEDHLAIHGWNDGLDFVRLLRRKPWVAQSVVSLWAI